VCYCLSPLSLIVWSRAPLQQLDMESKESVYRKQKTYKEHTGSVLCVAISPDGERWASGSGDKTVVLRERKSDEVQVLKGHTEAVLGVRFSRCGKFLFSASYDHSVIVWRVSTTKQIRKLEAGGSLYCLAISQRGEHLFCGGRNKRITKFHWPSGKKVLTMEAAHTRWIWCLAVSLCDGFVISGSWDKTVRVWKADDGVCVRTLKGHTNSVLAVVLIPTSGEVLASAGNDSTIRLWKWRTGEAVGVLKEANAVWSLAASPSGKYLLAGSYKGSISVWDLTKRALRQRFAAHDDVVYALAISPCGKYLVSGSHDKTAVEWKGIVQL